MALADARSASGRRITLAEFLQEAGLELEDVYRSGSWSGLQRDAGLKVPAPGPHETLIGDRLAGILHVDDPLRLGAYERLAASASVSALSDADRRLVTGFHFAVIPSKIAPKTLAESVALLHAHPAIVEELRELLPLLDERSEHLTYPLDLAQPGWIADPRAPVRACARTQWTMCSPRSGYWISTRPRGSRPGTIRDELDELGPVFCDARKIGTRVFAVHALQGLCDFAHAVPLGVAVDHHAAVEDRATLHSSPEPWRQHPAVRAS